MTKPLPPVRAFLSHSSIDKPYVQQVFDALGPTLAELDQVTFEPAKFNKDAILSAFDRCSVFVLFASEHSVKSKWVADEIKQALARLGDRQLTRILVYCPDKITFRILDPELKNLNIVRVEKTPLVCARQIRGILAGGIRRTDSNGRFHF
jgi:TIR domain